MSIASICTRTFFGTPSSHRASSVLDFLQRCDIRCSMKKMSGMEAVRQYKGDQFHICSKHFLMHQHEFYVIKVHFMDYQKALQAYHSYYDE